MLEKLRKLADAVMGYADQMARREDRPYMKVMAALCFIVAVWFGHNGSVGLAIGFAVVSLVWGAFLIPLRWVQHRYPEAPEPRE